MENTFIDHVTGLTMPGPGDPPKSKSQKKSEELLGASLDALSEYGDNYNYRKSRIKSGDLTPSFSDYKMKGNESAFGNYDIGELAAGRQSATELAAKGIGRALSTAVIETLNMPGYLGGAIGSGLDGISNGVFGFTDADNFIQSTTENSWVKFFDNLNDEIKTYMPVQQTKDAQTGNFGDWVTDGTFWATSGADGIGMLVSFLVPGAAVKALGVEAKAAKMFAKGISLASDENKIFTGILKTAAKAGVTAKNIDIATATAFSTFFESASEAKDAMNQFRIEAEKKGMTEDEINKISAKIGNNVFLANTAILLLPNFMANKVLLGKFKGKGLSKLIGYESKELGADIIKAGTKTAKQKALSWGKHLGGAILGEGFWEEGMQTTVSNYYQKNKDASFFDILSSPIKTNKALLEDYLKMLGSTEGQQSIFLGALFGGVMGSFGKRQSDKAEQERINNAIDYINKNTNIFEANMLNAFKTDSNGNIIRNKETGKGIIDEDKLLKQLASKNNQLNSLNILSYAQAIGDEKLFNEFFEPMFVDFVTPFTMYDGGMDVLEHQLQGLKDVFTMSNKQFEGDNITQSSYISNLINKAHSIKDDIRLYDDYISNIVKSAVDDPKSENASIFNNEQKNLYVRSYRMNKFYNKFKTDLLEEKQQIADKLGIDIDSDNDVFNKINDDLVRAENGIKETNDILKQFKTIKSQKKAFNNRTEAYDALREYREKLQEEYKKQAENKSKEETLKETLKKNKLDRFVEKTTRTIKKIFNKNVSDDKVNEAKNKNKGEEIVVGDKEGTLEKVTASNDIEVNNTTDGISAVDKTEEYKGMSIDEIIKAEEERKLKEAKEKTTTIGNVSEEPDTINTTKELESVEEDNDLNTNEINKEQEGKELKELLEEASNHSTVKVIGLNKDGSKVFDNIDDSFIDYLQNGKNKKGEKISFQFGNFELAKNGDRAKELIDKLNNVGKLTKNEIKVLKRILPLNIVTEEGHIGILSQGSTPFIEEKMLFGQVVDLLVKGVKIEDIYTEVQYQHPGYLNIDKREDGTYANNSLLDLKGIDNDINNIEFFVVNSLGNLVDKNKVPIGVSKSKKQAGAVYIKVKKNNGMSFYLKVNIRTVNDIEAEVIADIYEALLVSEGDLTQHNTLEDLPDELQNKIYSEFETQLSLLGKYKEEIVINEFVNFLISNDDVRRNIVSRNNFSYDSDSNILTYGINRVTLQNINQEKENIKNWLTSYKRRNFRFLENKNSDISIKNNNYKEFIIEDALSTNAVTKDENGNQLPLFTGDSNIFIKANVSIKGYKSVEDYNNDRIKRDLEEFNNAKESTLYDELGGDEAIDTLDDKISKKSQIADIEKRRYNEISKYDAIAKKRNIHGNGITFEKLNSINAKYDAELRALENQKLTKQEIIDKYFTEEEKQILKKLQEKYHEIELQFIQEGHQFVLKTGDKTIWNQDSGFDNQVNYTLKAVTILQSDKAKQVFEKGDKNNWSLDKILTKLQIPKTQKEIILEKYKGKVNEQDFIKSIFPDTKIKEIVYHGSPNFGFKEFSKDKLGEYTGAASAKKGFFFSNSLENSFSAYTLNIKKDVSFDDEGRLDGVQGVYTLGRIDMVIEDIDKLHYFFTRTLDKKQYAVKSFFKNSDINFGLYFDSKEEALKDYKNDDFYDSEKEYEIITNIKYKKVKYKIVDWNTKNEPEIYTKQINNSEPITISKEEYYKEKEKIKKELIEKREEIIKTESKNRVYSVILNSKTLKGFDDKGNHWRESSYVKRINETLKENRDGLVIRNTYDPLLNDIYVVFESEQIHILTEEEQAKIYNQENLREEIITSLLAENSFTVEVNLATIRKELGKQPHPDEVTGMSPFFIVNGDKYELRSVVEFDEFGPSNITTPYKNNNRISFNEYLKAKERAFIQKIPTQHYKSLSARTKNSKFNKYENDHNWEYQELEIKTPDITPNIKGHAQFSTDNGIGWFRIWTNKKTGEVEVQEIQSDLFQKSRNDKIIANVNDNVDKNAYEQNSFLQLLNKKDNWVNFFIQSIVQDSIKKGYEKVRFPLGETAAKIQGHDIIADKIKSIDKQLDIWNNKEVIKPSNYYVLESNDKTGKIGRYKTKEEALKKLNSKPLIADNYHIITVFDEGLSKNTIDKKIADLQKEKQELKTEGLEKLAPIEHFYENVVSKKVKTNYGKAVKEITDEHGNKWLEVNITDEVKKFAENILLQKQDNKIIGQANINAATVLIDAANMKEDAETVLHEYAHHYISWNRNTPIVQEAIKKWGSEEALVQAIGEQAAKQKGEAWNWWKKFVNWLLGDINKLSKLDKERLKNILTDAFLNRENISQNNLEKVRKSQKKAVTLQKSTRIVRKTKEERLAAAKIRNNNKAQKAIIDSKKIESDKTEKCD